MIRGRSRRPRWRSSDPSSTADPAHYVRGQYDGYLDIDGVAPDSTTETYAALRIEIENWRWSGVPFFIRTGKRLPIDPDRASARLQAVPLARLRTRAGTDRNPTSSSSSWTRRPASGSSLDAHRADVAGTAPIDLDMEFADEGGEGPTPYEVLLHAAMVGDNTRFARQDRVEETWRIMQPLLDAPARSNLRARIMGPGGR